MAGNNTQNAAIPNEHQNELVAKFHFNQIEGVAKPSNSKGRPYAPRILSICLKQVTSPERDQDG